MTLSAEELELITYLVGALLIGFIFGFLFAKSLSHKKTNENKIVVEKNYSSIVNDAHSE